MKKLVQNFMKLVLIAGLFPAAAWARPDLNCTVDGQPMTFKKIGSQKSRIYSAVVNGTEYFVRSADTAGERRLLASISISVGDQNWFPDAIAVYGETYMSALSVRLQNVTLSCDLENLKAAYKSGNGANAGADGLAW
ncbi:MAG TPA: hypothetical protein PL182_00420 [Pseudobdellovibrionaceae bacterium]|nr:hypothetical protein [Pseudobdellovibrionaceae bacterium]